MAQIAHLLVLLAVGEPPGRSQGSWAGGYRPFGCVSSLEAFVSPVSTVSSVQGLCVASASGPLGALELLILRRGCGHEGAVMLTADATIRLSRGLLQTLREWGRGQINCSFTPGPRS